MTWNPEILVFVDKNLELSINGLTCFSDNCSGNPDKGNFNLVYPIGGTSEYLNFQYCRIRGLFKYRPTLSLGVDRWTWFVFIRTFRCWRNTYWHIFFDLIFHLCWNHTAITIVRINYLLLSRNLSERNKHSLVIRGDQMWQWRHASGWKTTC